MKLAIMQPYFLPYIGYWQLINAVDKFVIYDDVNYINRGWINRNRFLVEGKPKYINISLLEVSQNKKINEIQVNPNTKLIKKKLRTIEYAYKRTPYFYQIYPIVEKILNYNNKNLAKYIENSIYIICDYLKIKTQIIMSSSLCKNSTLRGQEKILDICKLLGATEYLNAIGGQALYSFEAFKNRNIKLEFIKPGNINYKQFNSEFQSDLSIIDVMMFNSKEKIINELLYKYEVVIK